MTEQEACKLKKGDVLVDKDGQLWTVRGWLECSSDARLHHIEIENASGRGWMDWMCCEDFRLV